MSEGRLDTQDKPKTNIFGMTKINPATGQAELDHQQIFHGDNVFIEAEGYPFFYLPYIQGDINDPLGPLENINYKVDRVFGNQFSAQFNVYDLLGIDPDPGTRWKATTNYFDKRGPSLGTEYDYSGKEIFGVPGNYTGLVKAFGINDTGTDILGGDRGLGDDHPKWRGRFLERHIQELPEDFTVELQLSALSDKNFLEQYYKDEFDRDINQETFLYVKQQRDNWAWTVLTEPRIRSWVTETEWLPKADGYLIGQSFFDRLTYNVHASAGYGRLLLPEEPPPRDRRHEPAGQHGPIRPDAGIELSVLSRTIQDGPLRRARSDLLHATTWPARTAAAFTKQEACAPAFRSPVSTPTWKVSSSI